jgi:hypothetical protein
MHKTPAPLFFFCITKLPCMAACRYTGYRMFYVAKFHKYVILQNCYTAKHALPKTVHANSEN